MIDVFDSKERKHQRFPNTLDGLQKLIKTYQTDGEKKAILESTGVYQRLAHKSLEQAGFKVCVVNLLKSRNFACSGNFFAKTDKVDAKMLLAYGSNSEIKLRETPSYPSEQQEELNSLVSYREGSLSRETKATQSNRV